MMIKQFLSASIMLAISFACMAQTVEYNSVYRFRPRNSGAIMENNSIVGYYTFRTIEKKDKKNFGYQINFYDNNLNAANDFEVVKDKNSVMLEAVYNQNVFMLMFYAKKTIEFESYDKTGKKLGSYSIPKIPKMELYRINAAMMNPDIDNSTIYPLGSDGFVRSTFVKNDRDGYELQAFNNDMTLKWEVGSDEKSELLEYGDVIYASEKYVCLTVAQKKTKLTKKFDTEFLMIDAKTGAILCKFPVRDINDGELSLLNCFVDEKTGNAYLAGEFYKPGDEVAKDKSLGLYIREIESNGSDVNFKKYAWAREIAKFKQEAMTAEDKDKDKGTNQIWFHQFIQSANGHIFAIGEQYRKQVSAGGVAMNVLSGGGGSGVSNIEIKVTNMVVVEFDATLELLDYKLIPKKTTRVMLPEGYGIVSSQVLAGYLAGTGNFDYQFTSQDPKKDSYQVVYTDQNRKEEGSKEKADIMIGTININKGEKTNSRFPINSEARRLWYRPAKPGYIMVGEYWNKEKKVKLHLEKISE